MPSQPFQSNIAQWQELQERGYFENHPLYRDMMEADDDGQYECDVVRWFYPIDQAKTAVVIGCGYGRESVRIGRRVGQVYGIDVSQRILDKAVDYTRKRGVDNFTPVLAEDFEDAIPDGIDLVFSIVVFQHLTRDLARRYLGVLGAKLTHSGRMVIQVCEDFLVAPDNDAGSEVYEPSVSYSVRQVVEMARPLGLKLEGARSEMATDTALWHWVCLAPAGPDPEQYRRGRAPLAVDVKAGRQHYGALIDAPSPGRVTFSIGAKAWDYAAAIATGLTGDIADGVLEVSLGGLTEDIYVMAVDLDYQQIGERIMVKARDSRQIAWLPLPAGTPPHALVVQAGPNPRGGAVTLLGVAAYVTPALA